MNKSNQAVSETEVASYSTKGGLYRRRALDCSVRLVLLDLCLRFVPGLIALKSWIRTPENRCGM